MLDHHRPGGQKEQRIQTERVVNNNIHNNHKYSIIIIKIKKTLKSGFVLSSRCYAAIPNGKNEHTHTHVRCTEKKLVFRLSLQTTHTHAIKWDFISSLSLFFCTNQTKYHTISLDLISNFSHANKYDERLSVYSIIYHSNSNNVQQLGLY